MEMDEYAFKLLGSILAENDVGVVEYTANHVAIEFGVSLDIARNVAQAAFDKWVDTYYPT